MLTYLNWPQFYTHTCSIDCDRMPMPDILSLIDSFVFLHAPFSVCIRSLTILALAFTGYIVLCVNIMTRFSLDTSSKWRTQIPSWLRWKHDSSHGNGISSQLATCVNSNHCLVLLVHSTISTRHECWNLLIMHAFALNIETNRDYFNWS